MNLNRNRILTASMAVVLVAALTGTAFAQSEDFWDALKTENTEHMVTYQGTSTPEGDLVTPLKAYEGAVVTIVDHGAYEDFTGKTDDAEVLDALAEDEIYIGDDSYAQQYRSRDLTGSLAVVPAWIDAGETPDGTACLDMDTLHGLVRMGYDVLDESESADAAIYRADGENYDEDSIAEDLGKGWQWYIDQQFRPAAFVYPFGTDELVRKSIEEHYASALNRMRADAWPEDTSYANALDQDAFDLKELELTDASAETVKQAIDAAASENGWLILGTTARKPDVVAEESVEAEEAVADETSDEEADSEDQDAESADNSSDSDGAETGSNGSADEKAADETGGDNAGDSVDEAANQGSGETVDAAAGSAHGAGSVDAAASQTTDGTVDATGNAHGAGSADVAADQASDGTAADNNSVAADETQSSIDEQSADADDAQAAISTGEEITLSDDRLTPETLGEILDYIQNTENVVYLTYSEAMAARYGGVLQVASLPLFTAEDAPEFVRIADVDAFDYNESYQTEAGTGFSLYTQDGMVYFQLNTVLQEDLTILTPDEIPTDDEITTLDEQTGDLETTWDISSTLRYEVDETNYQWSFYNGEDGPLEGEAVQNTNAARYDFDGKGKWAGEAVITITFVNYCNEEVKVALSYADADGSGITLADTLSGTVTAGDITCTASEDGTPIVIIPATTADTSGTPTTGTLTLTIDGSKISGNIDADAVIGSLTLNPTTKLKVSEGGANSTDDSADTTDNGIE